MHLAYVRFQHAQLCLKTWALHIRPFKLRSFLVFRFWRLRLWASFFTALTAGTKLWANTATSPAVSAAGAAAEPTNHLSAWQAIATASWPVQITLLILVLMSVLSWTIMFCKKKQLQQIKKSNQEFLDAFWQASSLDSIFQSSSQYVHSTLARLFQNSYIELNKLKHSRAMAHEQLVNASEARSSEAVHTGGTPPPLATGAAAGNFSGAAPSNLSGTPSLKDTLSSLPLSMEYLDRSLRKAIDTELPSLESHLNFLATTGSTAPFIGLFGTVWGIMGAFQKIAQANSASLAVVAPGIAEALIATAIGLAVAIPATVAYNHFVARVRCEELELHNFAGDFLNLTKRNLYKPSGEVT